MLKIENLHVAVGDNKVLNGLDLEIPPVRSTPSWDPTAPARARWLMCWRDVPGTSDRRIRDI